MAAIGTLQRIVANNIYLVLFNLLNAFNLFDAIVLHYDYFAGAQFFNPFPADYQPVRLKAG